MKLMDTEQGASGYQVGAAPLTSFHFVPPLALVLSSNLLG